MASQKFTFDLFSAEKNRWYRILKITGLYLGLSILITALLCSDCFFNLNKFLRETGYNMMMTVALWGGNSLLTNWLDRKISWVDQPIKRAVGGILLMVAYSIGMILLIGLFFFVGRFGYSFEVFWEQIAPNYILVGLIITLFVALVLHSIGFLQHWREAALTAEKLKREKLASQYSSLKNQLNPHFLFNSLNTLSALVYKDPDASAKFIKQLSHIYRYVLENAEKEVVSVEKEVGFINDYLNLTDHSFWQKFILYHRLTRYTTNFHCSPYPATIGRKCHQTQCCFPRSTVFHSYLSGRK